MILPALVFFEVQGSCNNSTLPYITKQEPPKFFDPKDGRLEPKPGDRIAVWCDEKEQRIVVYGVTELGKGFELAIFNIPELIMASRGGLTKAVGGAGTISAYGDPKGYFYVAWNGAHGANGLGDFAKSFSCKVLPFSQPTVTPKPKYPTNSIDAISRIDFLIVKIDDIGSALQTFVGPEISQYVITILTSFPQSMLYMIRYQYSGINKDVVLGFLNFSLGTFTVVFFVGAGLLLTGITAPVWITIAGLGIIATTILIQQYKNK